MRSPSRLLLPLATFVLLVAAWYAAANSIAPELRSLFPGPVDVARAFAETSADGSLPRNVSASLARFLAGFAAALLVAVPLGFAFGTFPRVWTAVDPLVQVLRPISPIAWFPLFSLWFGIGELPAFVIIFMAAFYPALLSTIAAVRAVDPVYLKVARNFGTSRLATLSRVVFPAALPGIAAGARLAMGSAWVFLVAGEMLGVQTGLGFMIVDARNGLRTDLVVVGIIVIGGLGLLIDQAIRLAEKRVALGLLGGTRD